MTSLSKLAKYPHNAVFDVDPHGDHAFILGHENECSWSIADGILSVNNGENSFLYDLQFFTVGTLASALIIDGFQVSNVSAEFVQLNACVLIEGSGSSISGGAIKGFTNLLYAFFGGYAKEIREAGKQVKNAITQMVIADAEGEWLDVWGGLFSQKRRQNQQDVDYSIEIPREAFRERVNALAIEKAIFEITGKVVRINEPWELMFRLSESQLSGTHKFYNGNEVGPFILQPVSDIPIDWADVLPIIERNKAAGVIVLEPEVRPTLIWNTPIDGTIYMVMTEIQFQMINGGQEGRLSYLRLSDEEYIRNYMAAISTVIGISVVAESPVDVSMQVNAYTGLTWHYAEVWGPFTWNS
jgi:hypothetical protein